MKKTIVKNFLLLLMISLFIGSSVFGADANVSFTDGFDVIFAPGSYYSETDLFPNFKGVMPGDVLSQEIGIKNEAKDYDYIKVYMQAIPHDEEDNPLSPNVEAAGENVASMHDFLSQLMMSVYNEGVLIYQDSPDQPGALADALFLGQLPFESSLSLRVELEVPLSLSSDYMDRVGEVDWLFIVEGIEEIPSTNLTVSKVWKDDCKGRPKSIKVDLFKDGVFEERIQLNKDNQWTHSWTDLDGLANWTVKEVDVPDGYKVSYSKHGETVIITNTKEKVPPVVVKPVDLCVKKLWSDKKHPSSVEVTLFNGYKPVEKVILSQKNNWSYCWKKLDGKGDWRVIETKIPSGYVPIYTKKGNLTTITNVKIPTSNLTVSKVWKDDGKGRPKSVKVNLYGNGILKESIQLSEGNQWTYTWTDLSALEIWTVKEVDVPDDYEVSYSKQGNTVIITNTKEKVPPVVVEPVDLSVKKVWSDEDHPSSVEVTLYNGDKAVEEVTLSNENNWFYSWEDLDGEGDWRVVETEIPSGYKPSYSKKGDLVTITNVKIPTSNLTVSKIWEDDGKGQPEAIKVNLLKDGVLEESIQLNEDNQWTYTWTNLDKLAIWTVEEVDVPDGYKVSYSEQEETVMITNTKDVVPPEEEGEDPELVDLSVKKVWSDRKHPSSVEVTLYNGDKAVEKVTLSNQNNWSYSWKNLDGEGDWRVLETKIPSGYKPSYSKKGDLVTITNVKTTKPKPLPSTGASAALQYPILGSIFLALAMVFRKKKK